MATIQQIAAATGFSPSTVSIVLNGKGDARSISPATQETIMDTARRLNYRPSLSARSLRTGGGSGRVLGLYFSEDYRTSMMNRFSDSLWAYPPCQSPDISRVIAPYRVGELSRNMDLKSFSRFHGVILCNMNTEDLDYLARRPPAMPAVLYNRTLPGYSSVTVDNGQIGRIAAGAFARHSRRSAAILTVSAAFPGVDARLQGFEAECAAHGIRVLPPVICEASCEGGHQGIRTMLDQGMEFDCLFCGADVMAYGALRALLDAGVRIPDQVEVISVGNGSPQQAEYFWPSLSQVLVPIEDMARACFDLVARQIEDRSQEAVQMQLPVSYIPRESTGGR